MKKNEERRQAAETAAKMLLAGEEPRFVARMCGFKSVPAMLHKMAAAQERVEKKMDGAAVRAQSQEIIRASEQLDRLDDKRKQTDWEAIRKRQQARLLTECRGYRAMKSAKAGIYMITQKRVGESVLTVSGTEIGPLIDLLTELGKKLYDGPVSHLSNDRYYISRTEDPRTYRIKQYGHGRAITVRPEQIPDLVTLLTDLGVMVCIGTAE